MRKFVSIAAVCALSLTARLYAQESAAPAPAPTPAPIDKPAASAEATKLVQEELTLLGDMMDVIASAKDKATADTAAAKLKELVAVNVTLQAKLAKLPEADKEAALMGRGDAHINILAAGLEHIKRVESADYYGSDALKAAMQSMKPQQTDSGMVAPME